jgi:hypothetical protein
MIMRQKQEEIEKALKFQGNNHQKLKVRRSLILINFVHDYSNFAHGYSNFVHDYSKIPEGHL